MRTIPITSAFYIDNGELRWAKRGQDQFCSTKACAKWNSRYAGKAAGSDDPVNGYSRVLLNGKSLMSHRVIWILTNGPIPNGMQIDHINGNRSDNRVGNLRIASHGENQLNTKIRKSNSSGIKGVSWRPLSKKWQARVSVNGKQESLGYFTTLAAAEVAAKAARDSSHGQFANHG